MDVKMPDGTVITNVPDGITQEDLLSRVNLSKMTQRDLWKETAKSQSGLENFLAGLGGSLKGLELGARQVLPFVNSPSEQEVKDYQQAMSGLASTGSGMGGQFVGAALPAAATALIPGVNTLTGAALAGGVIGALDPVTESDSRLKNAALGAGLGFVGQSGANAIGRAIRPVQTTLPPQLDDLAKKAQQMGIDLNAAQQTGSKPLRWIDSALDNLPITAEKQAAKKLAQKEAWQKALLDKVGENADIATPDVMGRAKDRIGGVFQDLSSRNVVALDKRAQQEIAKVAAENAKAGPLSSSKVKEVTAWLDDITKPMKSPILDASGKAIPTPPQPMTGKQYQEVRSILTRKASDAFSTGDSQLGQSLKGIRNALDDAAERSINAADAEAWTTARVQWGTLKAVEKATDPTTGMISPKKFVNELTRKNPQGMIYGKGNQEIPDIAKVGKQFIAENLADSGTAQRAWYMNLLQNPGAGIGAALGFAGGGPVGAIGGMAAGAATPMAAHRAMWSPGGYFTRGLFDVTPGMAQLGRASALGIPMGLLELSQQK